MSDGLKSPLPTVPEYSSSTNEVRKPRLDSDGQSDEYNYPSRHNYYNTEGEDDPVTLTTTDYETMYDVKRNLDEIRENSNNVVHKINSMVTDPTEEIGEGHFQSMPLFFMCIFR